MPPSPRWRNSQHLGETWVEPEEAAYPDGGFTRRAYARFPDGRLRVVMVSIPDTYYTILQGQKLAEEQ